MINLVKFLKKDPYLLLAIAIAILAGWWLLRPGYFNMHDDLQMMRQLEMEKCFLDGQIPCRWVPDMGYGYGFPLFNFYPPLPYLIGEVMRVLHFSFVTSVKLTFLLSFVVSGAAMYVFAKEFFGRLGGLVSSAFYVWAPYHSVDIYVRGAANEAWALSWFPFILWSSYKLIREKKLKYLLALTLSGFALLVSHNLMVMIFAPVLAGWVLMWLVKYKAWSALPKLTISGIWALGLSSFFTLPVFVEQKYVQIELLTQGYYEYVAHFANIRQLLFSRFWGYGPSAWMDNDKMAFPVGHIHWILALVIAAMVIWRYFKTRKIDNLLLVAGYFFAAGWFAAFMSHSKSTFIWQQIPPLQFVQFPWRFLTLTVLSFSTMAGAAAVLLAGKSKKSASLLSVGLIILVIAWNWEFFRPEKMGPLTDQEKFSGAAWELQQNAGIYDYLPESALIAPKSPRKTVADMVSGEGQIKDDQLSTNWAKFTVDAKDTDTKVRINIFKFPDWRVFVDGKQVEVTTNKDELGRMHINVPQGTHTVEARLYNTPIRTASNYISLFAWALFLTLPFWKRRFGLRYDQ